jgi:hypothetical protein
MYRKMIPYCLFILFLILGYNAFLIQRDVKLFESYNHPHK